VAQHVALAARERLDSRGRAAKVCQISLGRDYKANTSQDNAEYTLSNQGSDCCRRLAGKGSSRPVCRSRAQASVSWLTKTDARYMLGHSLHSHDITAESVVFSGFPPSRMRPTPGHTCLVRLATTYLRTDKAVCELGHPRSRTRIRGLRGRLTPAKRMHTQMLTTQAADPTSISPWPQCPESSFSLPLFRHFRTNATACEAHLLWMDGNNIRGWSIWWEASLD
jgi:hypothetical protein